MSKPAQARKTVYRTMSQPREAIVWREVVGFTVSCYHRELFHQGFYAPTLAEAKAIADCYIAEPKHAHNYV